MKLLKSWRFIALAVVCVVVIANNLLFSPGKLPFTTSYDKFKVNEMLEDQSWVEVAPLVLKNHFRNVHVSNTGVVTKNGFGFQREIVRIFNVTKDDPTKQDPIDIRGKITIAELESYKQYPKKPTVSFGNMRDDMAKTHCAGRSTKYCTFAIYWDASFPTTSASFVGVRITDNSYALIEEGLLQKVLGNN